MIKIALFILSGIFLVAMTVINQKGHPTNDGIAYILICPGGLLLLGLISVNQSLRTRRSDAHLAANWIGLGLTLLLGVASAHVIYVWVYPDFPLQIRVAIDAVTLCLAASLLVRAVLGQLREDRQ
jgi:drug/metabolite transporter (DMT)-like permease